LTAPEPRVRSGPIATAVRYLTQPFRLGQDLVIAELLALGAIGALNRLMAPECKDSSEPVVPFWRTAVLIVIMAVAVFGSVTWIAAGHYPGP
jgi:hypothetical protein